jgi:hypothetical protein
VVLTVLTIFWDVLQYSTVKLPDVWEELTASRNVNKASTQQAEEARVDKQMGMICLTETPLTKQLFIYVCVCVYTKLYKVFVKAQGNILPVKSLVTEAFCTLYVYVWRFT